MIPSAFVMLEALPLTPNGKVDRCALPPPDGQRPDLAAYLAPRSGVEQTIAAVWQEVLRVEKVGVNDNFFELGGHSLLMAQVHTRLQKLFGQEFSMIELFKYPTISTLAGYIRQPQDIQAPQADDLIAKLEDGKQRLRQRLQQRTRGES
jgi:acyl carrier protein